MRGDALKILAVSAADEGGGAEKIAMVLFRALRDAGHGSWMAVGQRRGRETGVYRIPDAPWREAVLDLVEPLVAGARGSGKIRRRLRQVTDPWILKDRLRGREPFHYVGTRRLLDLPPKRPNMLHCHNLHGGYFDLRLLSTFSKQMPVVLSLHDEWAFTGHCAYTLGCARWRGGCGDCPHLDIYPAIRKDASAANWAAKRDIFAASRLYVATPSHWLMERVEASLMAPAIAGARVIPNGIDLSIFTPADRIATRRRLGLPEEALILLFTANRARLSPFKDFATVHDAVLEVARSLPGRRVVLLAVGDSGPDEKLRDTEIRFVPYQSDEAAVAAYYQAADVYLHAAHADNYPTTILEAMACGLPVVATAVGGIPEQIDSLEGFAAGLHVEADKATGILVPQGDGLSMARAARLLLESRDLRTTLSRNAATRARSEWSHDRMIADYLAWYYRIADEQATSGVKLY